MWSVFEWEIAWAMLLDCESASLLVNEWATRSESASATLLAL